MILFAVFIFIFFSTINPFIAGTALLIANLNYAIWITSLISSIQIFSDEKFDLKENYFMKEEIEEIKKGRKKTDEK